MTAPGETGLSPVAEAAYAAIRHEYSRRGRLLPDEPWTRILAEAVAEAVTPVVAAGERERVARLAEERHAAYPPSGDWEPPALGMLPYALAFAPLIREEPQQ